MLNIRDLQVPGYERCVVGRDEQAGLHAVIAVHSTALGPALGGVRMWPFETEQEATDDALRLAGISMGGSTGRIVTVYNGSPLSCNFPLPGWRGFS